MTAKNAIAGTLRQLPAFARLQEFWSKREDETEAEYWAFIEWLDRGSARGAPRAADLDLAERHEWAARAAAYERASELQMSLDRDDKQPEQKTLESLTSVLLLEGDKLLRLSSTATEMVLTPKDMVALIGLIADLQKKSIQAASAKTDLSRFTPEELRQILAAQALLKRAGTPGGK